MREGGRDWKKMKQARKRGEMLRAFSGCDGKIYFSMFAWFYLSNLFIPSPSTGTLHLGVGCKFKVMESPHSATLRLMRCCL